MRTVRIAVAQLFSEPGRVNDNAERMLAHLRRAKEEGVALVLFPECSLTGYSSDEPRRLALSLASAAAERILDEAARAKIAVCFGLIEEAGALPFITQVLFDGDRTALYRKTHLGSRERDVFGAGDTFPVTTLSCGIRCGTQLCWESHIPEISAALRSDGAELFLVPYASGMGGGRCRENWAVHLPARASDNGVFLAACNALKHRDDGSVTGGGIAVFDPKGRCLASYFGSEEHLLTCEIGGALPRESDDSDMHNISYFDRCRRELFFTDQGSM